MMAMVSRCSALVATLLVVAMGATTWADQRSDAAIGRSAKRSVDGPTALGVDTGDISLNIIAGSECVDPSDVVVVSLNISNLSAAINGAQALIHYDTTVLTLDSIAPAAPWSEVFEDDVAGEVTYSVIIPGDSILEDHTVATLTFTAVAEGTANVTFQPDNPPFLTKLTVASDNATILPNKFGSGNVFVGLPSCIVTADDSVCADTSGHAASVPDAGANATYEWTVTGGTLQTGAGSRSITYSAGAGTDVTLDVIVTDANGCDVSCQRIVAIDPNPVATRSCHRRWQVHTRSASSTQTDASIRRIPWLRWIRCRRVRSQPTHRPVRDRRAISRPCRTRVRVRCTTGRSPGAPSTVKRTTQSATRPATVRR